MSLINEALKKAQKQRTGEAPALGSMPNIGGEQPQQISRRAKPASVNALLVRLGLGAAALLVVIVGGIFLLRGKSAPEATSAPKTVAAAPAAKPVEEPVTVPAKTESPAKTITAPAKAAPAPAAKPSENVFVLPIAPPPEATKAAAVTPKAEPKAEAPKPVAAAPVVQPAAELPAPPKPAGRLEPRAIQYIENLKVAGIRISGNDSKVLMNDRVYRVGNTIEHEMGLKLIGITANSLTFEDEQGGRYTRNF